MLGRKNKEYCRWDIQDDETEMSVTEEQLNFEEIDGDEMILSERNSSTFVRPLQNPRVRIEYVSNIKFPQSIQYCAKGSSRLIKYFKGKVGIIIICGLILMMGFLSGLYYSSKVSNTKIVSNARDLSTPCTKHITGGAKGKDHQMFQLDEDVFRSILLDIKGTAIRRNLRRMSQEVHGAVSEEGKAMSVATRDLWRNYGLSVRIEQHKSLITTATKPSQLELYNKTGAVIFQSISATSKNNNIPLVAFSPSTTINASLFYAHYGREEDFKSLKGQGRKVNGSIALIRLGKIPVYQIISRAILNGCTGIILYPDKEDFGQSLPADSAKRISLLTIGQLHEYQKHKSNLLLPAYSISYKDAKAILRLIKYQEQLTEEHQENFVRARLLVSNDEEKSVQMYNVIGSIPGVWESDRYIIVGCSHSSWGNGAGDPGLGLAMTTELIRIFTSAVRSDWRPRRSILFISWDTHLYGFSGVWHWLQEHYFEIWSRAIAYIDVGRLIQGNHTLQVYTSSMLREVTKMAIEAVKKIKQQENFPQNFRDIIISSTLTFNEPAYLLFGNLGVPFLRFTLLNCNEEPSYPLFQTSYDSYENFVKFFDDPNFYQMEDIGRILASVILLLADSPILPMNVEDFVNEIQQGFTSFTSHHKEILLQSNISIAYLQAAVMRLQVIGDNFRTEFHNRSVINTEYDYINPPTISNTGPTKPKALFHRILNDKLMALDRAFLSKRNDGYRHQGLGYTPTDYFNTLQKCNPKRIIFPKLSTLLECKFKPETSHCPKDWANEVSQEIQSLIRSINGAAAILQSPLLPEEADTSNP